MDLQLSSILKEGLFYLGILVLVIGVLLALFPRFFIEKSTNYNAWIDTDKYFNFVNQTRSTERKFYKYNKAASAVIFFLSLYTLYVLTITVDADAVSRLFSFAFLSPALNSWLAQAMLYILVLFNIIAFFLSIVLFIRPSALKGLEELTNTWFSTDSALHAMDEPINIAEGKLTAGKLRGLGVFVVIACLYILFFMY